MLISTTKITRKGQVTLPKEVRDILHTDIITFEIKDNNVMIKPINKVSGSLRDYKKDISFQDARNKAWNELASNYEA
jgi:AbrB family looped-hinge helix DNA binding protein